MDSRSSDADHVKIGEDLSHSPTSDATPIQALSIARDCFEKRGVSLSNKAYKRLETKLEEHLLFILNKACDRADPSGSDHLGFSEAIDDVCRKLELTLSSKRTRSNLSDILRVELRHISFALSVSSAIFAFLTMKLWIWGASGLFLSLYGLLLAYEAFSENNDRG